MTTATVLPIDMPKTTIVKTQSFHVALTPNLKRNDNSFLEITQRLMKVKVNQTL